MKDRSTAERLFGANPIKYALVTTTTHLDSRLLVSYAIYIYINKYVYNYICIKLIQFSLFYPFSRAKHPCKVHVWAKLGSEHT